MLVARREQELRQTIREFALDGFEAAAVPCDLTRRGEIATACTRALDHFGAPDILVNAAGRTRREPTSETSEQDWAALIDTNLNGVLRACQSFYPLLKESGHGRVINIASLGSYLAFHEVAAYCASKSAVLSLTRSLGCEWAQDGIVVNAIAPGVFPTELNGHLLTGTERGREILQRTPLRRYGRTDEIVGTAVLLASDAASFIIGQCFVVDGGYLAAGVNT